MNQFAKTLTLEPDDPYTFEGILTIIITRAEHTASGKQNETQDTILKSMPFFLGQAAIAPLLLIAATTSAEQLAKYIKEPSSAETQKALSEAVNTCLTIDVPWFTGLVLGFFDKFAPWSACIQGCLSLGAQTTAEVIN